MADGSACAISLMDERLAGHDIKYMAKSVKCKLNIHGHEKSPQRRNSIYATDQEESKYVVFAAIAVTDKALIVDVQRMEKDPAPRQYICLAFEDPLFSELGLEFDASHLNFVLPNAERFLGPTAELGVPPDAEVRIGLTFPEAPDIAMYVNGLLRDLTGINCQIRDDDPRLAGQRVEYSLQGMKVKLYIDNPGRRSSVYATPEAASRHKVFAALAVTDQRIILDVTWAQKDTTPREYLNLEYTHELFKEVLFEFANDDINSHLKITIPKAARFIDGASLLSIPDDANLSITVDTWKAPDVVMYVSRKTGRRASVCRT